LRLKTRVDFTRAEFFADGTLDYFPWGKPEGIEGGAHKFFERTARCLRGTKPYFSVVSGYSRQTSLAHVGLSLPLVVNALAIEQRDTYDLFYVCPRVSVEIPLRKNDFLDITLGYAFFGRHTEEFNSVCAGFFWKHRF